MSSGDKKYGTFSEKDKPVVQYEWEGLAAPWALFVKAAIIVGKNAAALLLLFWTLLRGPAAKRNLMQCNPMEISEFQTIGCEYTKAFMRAFPLLAMCVTMAIAMRSIVQQRVYYGFLKAGGLLDFTNVQGWKDPLLLVLIVSMLHAVLHFGLKLSDDRGDRLKVLQQIGTNFLAPYIVFMSFLYASNDIESMLVPLNKYVEEDPEYARRVLSTITHMEETVVRTDVLSRDVVGAALEEDEDEASIDAVYREVMRGYPEAQAGIAEQEGAGLQFHLKESLWPARMLVDPRLTDEKSSSFRLMFHVFLGVCFLIQITVFVLFFQQAVLKDLYNDYWLNDSHYDIISSIVLLVHAGFVVWIMNVTMWPVMASAAEEQVGKLKKTKEKKDASA